MSRTFVAYFSSDNRTKKHKVYDEGLLLLEGGFVSLVEKDTGTVLGKQRNKSVDEGQSLTLGKFSVDVGKEMPSSAPSVLQPTLAIAAPPPRPAVAPRAALKPAVRPAASVDPIATASAGAPGQDADATGTTARVATPAASFVRRVPLAALPPAAGTSRGGFKAPRQQFAPPGGLAATKDVTDGGLVEPAGPSQPPPSRVSAPPPPSVAARPTGLIAARPAAASTARYDPTAPGALVLQEAQPAPSASVAVVVDPLLAAPMRPHQRAGVRFLWECVQGLRAGGGGGGRGCILADDMGLGKTLTTIALLWTLLRQSGTGAAAISRAVVVCPSSLVGNWRAEIKKWLGDERVRPVAVTSQGEEAAAAVRDFILGSAAVRPVLIISYEMLRKHVDVLTAAAAGGGGAPRIGLLVCDEAHRLKSAAGSKTLTALGSIATARRVLLTGTPIQNDLSELYAMVSFANPGSLGSLADFKRVFERPIVAGRDGDASPEQRALSAERSAELSRQLSQFVLRRSSSVLEALLPPKTETSLFCRLSPLQQRLYEAVAGRASVPRKGAGQGADVLVALNLLRQICGHPDLALASTETEKGAEGGVLDDDAAPAATAAHPSRKFVGKRRRGGTMPHASGADDDSAASASHRDGGSASSESESDVESDGGAAAAGDSDSEPLELALSDDDAAAGADDESGNDEGSGGVISTDRKRGTWTAPRMAGPTPGSGSLRSLLRSLLPPDYTPLAAAAASGDASALTRALGHGSKLAVLDGLLRGIRTAAPQDRIVIVSNFGRTLDLVSALCTARGWATSRLDGSTPPDQRTALVARFNARDAGGALVFLLSAQAGGAGINLIGANRLVLMDSSWNPAIDAQALARVWRDGQQRPCFIYRLACTATIDEKILQRQLLKADVAGALGHGEGGRSGGGAGLSRAELLELFALDPRATPAEGCDTRRIFLARAAATGAGAAAGRGDALACLSDAWPAWGGVAALADDPPAAAAAAVCAGLSPAPPLVTYAKRALFNAGRHQEVGALPDSVPVPPRTGGGVGGLASGADALDLD